jgi:hypothetical protein
MFRPHRKPLALAAVLAATALAVPAAQAGTGTGAATFRPEPLAPPAGHRLVATFLVGQGTQVYECLPDAATGGSTWRGRPVAVLVTADRYHAVAGTHDSISTQGTPSVPQWNLYADGSRVVGRLATGGSFPAPDPTKAIAALRLDVVQNSGIGVLAGVDTIQRDLVRGGVGPSGACDAATDHAVVSRYGARYTFWAPTS